MSVVKNFSLKLNSFCLKADELVFLDEGVTALQGPSGSGKSSFAKALLGLIPTAQGQWLFKDSDKEIDLMSMDVRERHLGVVFQDYALFPHMTAKENIFFAAEARKISSDIGEQLYQRLSQALGLGKFFNTKAIHLSGGESQRVALARALMGRPRFLILDEAFVSLDKESKHQAYQICKNLIQETKIPTLLITHDDDEVDFFSAKKLIINKGTIVEA